MSAATPPVAGNVADPMNLLILGAGGMIGCMLSQRLVRVGRLTGTAIFGAHLVDIGDPDSRVAVSGRRRSLRHIRLPGRNRSVDQRAGMTSFYV
jgi:hypothetical protein